MATLTLAGLMNSEKTFYKLTLGSLKNYRLLLSYQAEEAYDCLNNTATLIVALKEKPDLTIKELEPITLEWTIQDYQDNAQPYKCSQVLHPQSVTLLEVEKKPLDLYYYEITTQRMPKLLSRLDYLHSGDVKKIIEKAFELSGLKPADYDLTKLKHANFGKDLGYYLQTTNENTGEFVARLLQRWGGHFYIDATGKFIAFDDIAAYEDSEQALGSTQLPYKLPSNLNWLPIAWNAQEIGLFNLHQRKVAAPYTAITIENAAESSKDNIQTLRNESHNYQQDYPNQGQYHAVEQGNNIDLSNLPQKSVAAPQLLYTANASLPLQLGKKYTIHLPNLNNNDTTLKKPILTPIAIKARVVLPRAIDSDKESKIHREHLFEDLCGLPPVGQMTYEVTLIEADKLPPPMLRTSDDTPRVFDAVVVTGSGEITGNISTGDTLYAALLYRTPRDNGKHKPFNIKNRLESASIDSAAPVPGSIIRVMLLQGQFTLLGVLRNGFTENTVIENDKNAQHNLVKTKVTIAPATMTHNTEKSTLKMEAEKIEVSFPKGDMILGDGDKKDGIKISSDGNTEFWVKENFEVTSEKEVSYLSDKNTIRTQSKIDILADSINIDANKDVKIKGTQIKQN